MFTVLLVLTILLYIASFGLTVLFAWILHRFFL